MRALSRLLLATVVVVWVPSLGLAQVSIAGLVKDTSGAVLPGVTAEASSPALIEKVRSAVTDGAGQYRIENLRPGVYTVTFSLAGFTTIKREGIELTGSFTATVSVEMKVGAVSETIVVTGETPVVDVVHRALVHESAESVLRRRATLPHPVQGAGVVHHSAR